MIPDPLRFAILERPNDDAPRLMAIDWLEENGHVDMAEQWKTWLNTKTVSFRFFSRDAESGSAWALRDGLSGWGREATFTERRGMVETAYFASAEMFISFPDSAATLFRKQPITRIRFLDKTPLITNRNKPPGWSYIWRSYSANKTPSSSVLPPILFPLPGRRRANYPSASLAVQAVSDRAVAWGRSLVGLPPL